MRNGSIHRTTGGNSLRPLNKHRHTKPTFKHSDFPAAEWTVYIPDTDVACATVITGKNDYGVIRDAFCFQRIKYAADTAINCANHARVNSLAVRFNAT